MATSQAQAPAATSMGSGITGIDPEKWKEHGIVPEIFDQPPPHQIQVEYGEAFINYGTEIKRVQTRLAPTRVSWATEPNSLYTLCVVDLDAPIRNHGFLSPINHWFVVNIPGNDIASGRQLTPYLECRPPPGGGLHRYVFVVYKQTGEIQPAQVPKFKFNLKEFATKHELGQPIAGNFFVVQGSVKESCNIA